MTLLLCAIASLIVAVLLLALRCSHMADTITDLDNKITQVEATVASLPGAIATKVADAVAAALANVPSADLTAEVARIDALDVAIKQAVA